jgi:hypothetical protein
MRRIFLLLVAGLGFATAPCRATTLAHWRFEGDGAGFTADASGNNRTLTLAGGAAAPTQIALPANGAGSRFHNPLPQNSQSNLKAAQFDGGDRATSPDDPAFTGATFSVEAYIHLANVSSTTQFVAGHFDSSVNQRSWALVITQQKLALYLSANGGGIESLISNFTVVSGKDYFVAATVNLADSAATGITLYLQNLSDSQPLQMQAMSHATTAVLNSTAPFSVGATANATSPLNGIIDEVRVSNDRLAFNQLLAVDPSQPPPDPDPLPFAEGFRGIWYQNGPTGDQYAYKYSGGMATYPQQHIPIAVYSADANKTFFVYGGTDATNSTLLHMVSSYDHATRRVARPRTLLNKATTDAHDNPVLSVDDGGHLWIFSNTHGEARRSWLHKSTAPGSIDRFTEVPLPAAVFPNNRFNYGQPWWVPGHGFFFLHIRYNGGERDLYWTTSPDGVSWTPRGTLSQMLSGQYQISGRTGEKVASAFNVHPPVGGLDARTNLYYLETSDMGTTWKTITGAVVTTPLTDPANPALVHDYMSEGRLVYLKDITFDAAQRPVILYVTSADSAPGPQTPARMATTARWTGTDWIIREVVATDHNYDHGSLYIEPDGAWRILGTFLDGPQQFGTGGEIGIWTSQDQGATWQLARQVTTASPFNHNYPRHPVNARDDFYTLWADGNAFVPSSSSLYFTDKFGDAVLRLPAQMQEDFAFPEVVRVTDPTGDPDADGANNANEFTAGTNPRDPQSVLRVQNIDMQGSGFRLTFGTVSGKRYRILYKNDLKLPNWLILMENIAGTGAAVTIEDTNASSVPQRFYRVEVMQ